MSSDPRANLERIFGAALAAVDARGAVEQHIGRNGEGLRVGGFDCDSETRVAVLAIGKASASMVEGAANVLGASLDRGLVITKDGHARGHALDRFEVVEASHPVPDERSAQAGQRAIEFAASTRDDELLLVLLSGGASSLVSLPPEGVSLEDLARTNELLLGCGADIGELNTVRKHLSQISGGRLARAAKARRIAVLAVSDVPGDALDVIGSGPCAPDPTHYADALQLIERYGLASQLPESVRVHLERGRKGSEPESPKPGDAVFDNVRHEIVASNEAARTAALQMAESLGADPISLGECLRGEARVLGSRIAAMAAAIARDRPVCLVAGGESVVRIAGKGVGGRNQELALAAAVTLSGFESCNAVLLAAGTDGSDGPTRAAGGFADSETVARGMTRSANAVAALAENDSNTFFSAEGGLFVTGPTGTNVMDLVLVWVPAIDSNALDE